MTDQSTQQIQDNQVVSMHYTLKDASGKVIDSSDGQEPLTYLHGAGNIIPGLERALVGKVVGDQIKVEVAPADAYGESNPDLIQTVNKALFHDVDSLEPGMVFQVQAGEGQPPQRITIKDVVDDEVIIDGNHPLAGETLHFDVDIVALRDASDSEIEHGHAH